MDYPAAHQWWPLSLAETIFLPLQRGAAALRAQADTRAADVARLVPGGSMTAKLSKELRRAIVDALLRDRVVVFGLFGDFKPRTVKKSKPKPKLKSRRK